MRATIKKLTILTVGIMTLTSCVTLGSLISEINNTSVPSDNTSQQITSVSDTTSTSTSAGTTLSSDPNGLGNFYKVATNPYANTALDSNWDVATFPSVGNQKMLVVPIKFTDVNASAKYGTDTTIVNTLTKTFFGATNDTGWESVSSFYAKSSYNKLNITGEVLSPMTMPYTTTQLASKPIDDTYWDATHYVLETVYNGLTASKLKSYDQNNDGYVDSVFLVYLTPTNQNNNSDLFWAYQFYWSWQASNTKPVFSTYAWASYEFAYQEMGYSILNPDAHTFIHETGHLLGLDDYYDYDGKTGSAGGVDMMDYNIIDHNMYSKYRLNWSTPYYATGNSDIYLRPAESSGDFILLNSAWNGHAFDEYILIEYYTPTGLNQKDSLSSYAGGRGFTKNGVRIWHIDSRLIRITNNSSYQWTDTIALPTNNAYTDYGTSNTPRDSKMGNTFRKVHLLDGSARATNWYKNTSMADNNALFTTGDKITTNGWLPYLIERATFNDGSAIGFSVEIGAMTNDGVTIKLRKSL